MKRAPLRLLLVVALPGLGFAAAWGLARLRAPDAKLAHPAAPAVQPRLAERRALVPSPAAAAQRPAAELPAPSGDGWVELNNEATTDLAAGALSSAVEKLERCLAAQPENPVYAGNLGEALVRLARAEHERGELASAIEHLARAIDVAPSRQDVDILRRILERWRKELELGLDDWTEGSSRFELTYDTDRDDILRRSHEVLEHLELTYDDLVLWFGRDPFPATETIRVVLYDPEDFDRLTGLGDWAAGVFDGVVRVSVRDLASGRGWRDVLVYELVHAFVQALAGPDVPGWLNEGLAQMLENRPAELALMRERLRGAELFPLAALRGSLASWQDSAAIGRAYAQSFLFVDHLRATFGDESLRRMLLGIAQGVSPDVAFQQWTAVALEVAFQDWCAVLAR